MSRDRIELVRSGFEAWNSGDRQWVLDHMSPEVEWITPAEDPDPGHYRGFAELERFWEQWRVAVGQLRFEIEDVIDAGDNVVVIARRSGTGTTSGISVSDRIVQVFSFDGELCVKVQEYY
ncbi:MAG: nuclear transport factor 2 family protein, partial [Solirubrobacterales bacterium]